MTTPLPPKRVPISWPLLGVLAIFIIGMIITGYGYYHWQIEKLKTDKGTELQTIAELKVRQIDHWLSERKQDAQVIFADSDLAEHVESLTQNPRQPFLREKLQTKLNALYTNYDYFNVLLFDKNEHLLLAAGDTSFGYSHTLMQDIKKVIKTRQVSFSDIHLSYYNQSVHIDIIIPLLRESKTPDISGVLVMRINPHRFLFPFIQSWPTNSKTGETLLVRREGDNVTFLNELRYRKNTALTFNLPLSSKIPAALAVQGKTGLFESNDYRGIPVLAVSQSVPGTQWYVVSKMDIQEVFKPMRSRIWMLSLVVSLMVLVAALGVLQIWRSQNLKAMQEQLQARQENEQLLSQIDFMLKHANDAITTLDLEGNILDVNEKSCRLHGAEAHQMIGKHCREFIDPQRHTTLAQRLTAITQSDGLVYESMHRRLDGTLFPVEVSARLMEYSGKQFIQSIIRDISERKAAEKALAESERRFRDLTDLLPLPVFEVDLAGNFTFVNQLALQKYLYTPEDLQNGLSIFQMVIPEQHDRIKEGLEGVLAGEKYPGIEYTGLKKDGTCFPVMAYTSPIYFNDRVAGFRGVIIDITEEKRNQTQLESLRHLSNRLSEVATLGDIGLIVAEVSRKIFHHDAFTFSCFNDNGTILAGIYSEDTPEGANAPAKVPAVDMSYEDFKNTKYFNGQSALVNRLEPVRDGTKLLFGYINRISRSIMYVPIMHKEKPVGTISVHSYTPGLYSHGDMQLLEGVAAQCGGALTRIRMTDERIRLEEKILQAQKLESLGVLSGGIAHDFNNLLMTILGNADLALRDISPMSPVRDCIKDIESASLHAADLCKQLLAYSGKGRFVVELIHVNELVKEMSNMLSVTISKKIMLNYHLQPELPYVEVDATQLRQVIMNLITNASDAIGDEMGNITLTTGVMMCDAEYLTNVYLNDNLKPGEYVYIEVADSGCGMSPETIKRIFDPFFSTKFIGRGLGLAAVLGIIKGHRGTIKVYSEPGKGTTFKVLLPGSGITVNQQSEQVPRQETWTGEGMVLVIDDEDSVRLIAKKILNRAGYDVLLAKDGPEGLTLMTANLEKIKFVLLDMTMPVMNGEEVFRELKRISPEVKVILSSGFNEQDTINRFRGKGLAGFIQKPYRSEELISKIRELYNHPPGG